MGDLAEIQHLPSDASIGCLRIDGALVLAGEADILVGGMIAVFLNEHFQEGGSKLDHCINSPTKGQLLVLGLVRSSLSGALIWIRVCGESWNRIYQC